MKICTKCKKKQPISEFHSDITKMSGLKSNCKTCVRAYIQANRISINEYNKQWFKSPTGIKWARNRYKKAMLEYPQKIKARWMVRDKLEKEPCKICSSIPAQAHHSDYDKPLLVVWLCKTHHSMLHRS